MTMPDYRNDFVPAVVMKGPSGRLFLYEDGDSIYMTRVYVGPDGHVTATVAMLHPVNADVLETFLRAKREREGRA